MMKNFDQKHKYNAASLRQPQLHNNLNSPGLLMVLAWVVGGVGSPANDPCKKYQLLLRRYSERV